MYGQTVEGRKSEAGAHGGETFDKAGALESVNIPRLAEAYGAIPRWRESRGGLVPALKTEQPNGNLYWSIQTYSLGI